LINLLYQIVSHTLDKLVSIKKCIEPGSNAYQDDGIIILRANNLSIFDFKNGSHNISTLIYIIK